MCSCFKCETQMIKYDVSSSSDINARVPGHKTMVKLDACPVWMQITLCQWQLTSHRSALTLLIHRPDLLLPKPARSLHTTRTPSSCIMCVVHPFQICIRTSGHNAIQTSDNSGSASCARSECCTPKVECKGLSSTLMVKKCAEWAFPFQRHGVESHQAG